MSREELRIDVLAELLEECKVTLTRGQLSQIASDFCAHLEMEREEDSYQFSAPGPCGTCAKKQQRIGELENEARLFKDSIVELARASDDAIVRVEYGRVTIQGTMR